MMSEISIAVKMAHEINNPLKGDPDKVFEVFSKSPSGKRRKQASLVKAESPEDAIAQAKRQISRHYDLSKFTWYVEPSYVVKISYEMLCWKMPIGSNKHLWATIEPWQELCCRSGLDRDFHLAAKESPLETFWVSPQLWRLAKSQGFANE